MMAIEVTGAAQKGRCGCFERPNPTPHNDVLSSIGNIENLNSSKIFPDVSSATVYWCAIDIEGGEGISQGAGHASRPLKAETA
jgi:hypothetical protein